jgi:hypothetical protein
MKQHLLLTVMLAFALFGVANAQNNTTYHGKGAFAQSNFPGISLSAYNGDESYNGQTFLMYSTFTSNPDGSYSYGSGDGFIPASAFSANNLQQMSLNVDTSQVPGFSASTCVATFAPTYTITCSPGPYGIIQVNWQQNGSVSSSLKENSQSTDGPYSTHVVDDNNYVSANSTGTFLGISVVDDFSEMGASHGSTVTRTKPD